MTKGFEYRITNKDTHLFITNKKGNVTFSMGTFNGKPLETEQLTDAKTISITEKQFIELVERLAYVSFEMIDKHEKKNVSLIAYDVEKPKQAKRSKK